VGHDELSVVPWHELTVTQRALTVEGSYVWDDDYPVQQAWSLHAAPDWAEAAAALGERLAGRANAGVAQLAAVGDVMLDRALGDVVATGDIGFPFAFVADIFHNADYAIANLESALGDRGEPTAKSYTFRAPPEAAQSVALAGIDLVSLANNHALDFGPQALLQGMALLEQQGVSTVGAGEDSERARRPQLVTLNGLTFAFLAYVNVPVEGRAPYFDTAAWTAGPQSPGMAWASPDVITADVSDIRESVDHVVVILHSGYEYVPAPSPEQVAASRAAIDAGAALVIGHHAHILQGVEFRGDGAIVYGLGNFAFNIDGSPETAILNAWFDRRGLRQIRFIPARINPNGQPQPVVADDASASIRRRIYTLSNYLN
jgi:poly-gamma-glutamate synthesis protein (capsule biosynthesis protein)